MIANTEGLSERQANQISAAAHQIIADRKDVRYPYDEWYRHRYNQSEILEIFERADPTMTLSQADLDVLVEDGELSLSKSTLVKLGVKLLLNVPHRTSQNAAKFAILVLLWGYASQGYGKYRVERILITGRTKLGGNVLNALGALQENRVAVAYDCWTGGNQIEGIGESFLTKILYFLAKIILPENPIAVIKDQFTSRKAASLFGISSLRGRGLTCYLTYLTAIDLAAQATSLTKERVEEILFTIADPGMLESRSVSEPVVEVGFAFAEDQQEDFKPPVLVGEGYQEPTVSDDAIYRVMLVADGKPKCGDLPEMKYAFEKRPILDDFYRIQREGIIREANAKANECRQGTPTYVMTTGFGAVAITDTINLYNVPGQEAIRKPRYWNLYAESLLNLIPSEFQSISAVVVVYYAGGSKQLFRDGIFNVLSDLSKSLSKGPKIRFCMYGATRHPMDRWDNLCRIFLALSTDDTWSLQQLQRKWERREGISPFFKWG